MAFLASQLRAVALFPQRVDRLLEISGRPRGERHRLTRRRVNKPKPPGMKRLAVDALKRRPRMFVLGRDLVYSTGRSPRVCRVGSDKNDVLSLVAVR
jgi:hypothetical protein